MYIEDGKNKTINSHEMAYLYVNDSKIFSYLVMLDTLNIPTDTLFKKDKQFVVRCIMMYPCNSILRISDF